MNLNVGAGNYPLEGFINLDLPDFDMTNIPWSYPSDSIDICVMSHVLEHVTYRQARRVLREVRRVLRPGGILHISTPNMDKFIDCRLRNDFSRLGDYPWLDLNDLLGGGEKELMPAMRHKYMWSWGSLYYILCCLGYRDIRPIRPGIWDNPQYRRISLYVEARA